MTEDSVTIKLAWFDPDDLRRLRAYAEQQGVSLARAIADKAALGLSGGYLNRNTGDAENVIQARDIHGGLRFD